jgi:HAD superfamily hydrolase (TIGR01549 family)
MNKTIYSFDVFDTCLVRIFPRPTDLFYTLAQRVLAETVGAEAFGKEEISEIALARVAAEKQARKNTEREEIRLVDIYAYFPELKAWGISAEQMQRLEIELELASVRPVASIKRQIEYLKREGRRVIFLSDMYLPEAIIRQMLVEQEIASPEDPLYVSSEVGLTKRSGELFKYILQREGISPQDLQHCGDSILGDYLAARKLKINAHLFTESQLNRYEKAIIDSAQSLPWIYAQIAGICRVVRLASGEEKEEEELLKDIKDIAANVIAPLLTSFVLWVLNHGQKQGLTRLYFVARDGQILLKIAGELAQSLATPELLYLYGSRQAWYLPSVVEVNRDDLSFFLLIGQSLAPRHNLEKVNLTPEEIEDTLECYGFPRATWDEQLDEQSVERFWRVIADPEVAPLVLKNAHKAREVALNYFSQGGLLKDNKWALVDVGWTLRTQTSLKKILETGGQNHTLGYYLGITKHRFSAIDYGRCHSFFLEEFEQETTSSGAKYIFQNKGFIDQVFTMANHGSTYGYVRDGEKIVPLLSNLSDSPQRKAFVRTVHNTVVTFARELAKTELVHQNATELKECGRLVTGMFLAKPTRREVLAIAWVPISDDPNEVRYVQLAKSLSPFALYKIARDVVLRLKNSKRSFSADARTVPRLFYKDLRWGFSWLEGSVALSGPWAKLAVWGFKAIQVLNREKKALAITALAKLQKLFFF